MNKFNDSKEAELLFNRHSKFIENCECKLSEKYFILMSMRVRNIDYLISIKESNVINYEYMDKYANILQGKLILK